MSRGTRVFVGAVVSIEKVALSADGKSAMSPRTPERPLSKIGIILFSSGSGPMSLLGCWPKNLNSLYPGRGSGTP